MARKNPYFRSNSNVPETGWMLPALPERRELAYACLACCAVLFLTGCVREAGQLDAGPSWGRSILIPQDGLPAGWRMMGSDQMPWHDRIDWWRENPQLLQGPELEAVRKTKSFLGARGKPTRASRILAVVYEGPDHNVVTLAAHGYASLRDARAEYEGLRPIRGPESDGILGYSRQDTNTIVVLMWSGEACPDREFFLKHFRAITQEGSRNEGVP